MLQVTYLFCLAFIIGFCFSGCSLNTWAANASTPPGPGSPALPPPTHTAALTPLKAPTGLTAKEFYNLALAHLPQQSGDAVLIRLDSGLLWLLDPAGTSTGWTADFWSPSTGQRFTLTLLNGVIITQARPDSTPDSTVAVDSLNLDLAGFLEKAAAAGGHVYRRQGYRTTAGLWVEKRDPAIPTWTITYLSPDQPLPAFSVILDARSGQVLGVQQPNG